MAYWCIILESFENHRKHIYYFENYEIAKKNFDNICDKYKNYPKFDYNIKNDYCSWLEEKYDYGMCFSSAYLTIKEREPIYNKIIF